MNTNLRYLFVVVLLCVGGALAGESIISSFNLVETVIGAVCLIVAVVLLLRIPVKR